MYETVSISAHGLTAKIRLAGAQIMSLVDAQGRELIWTGDPAVWPQHSTILFPVCGGLKNKKITIGGQEFDMLKHGFMKYAPFTVVKLGDDFVELVYESNDETRACYPFEFVFHATYTLLEDGYTTTFLVENKGDKPTPFCVGGHPGYTCPLEEGASLEDYQVVFEKPESGMHALLDGSGVIQGEEPLESFPENKVINLRYDEFDRFDTLLFTKLNSRSVSLVHKDSGKGLKMVFPKFPALALWTATGKKAPYLCIEPWIGIPAHKDESGCIEDKPYVVTLEAGKCHKSWFTTTWF